VFLCDLPALVDFSFCHNIYSLELMYLSGLRNCLGVANIHYLHIERCDGLISTEGLGKVTGKCILKNCWSLSTLQDLTNIPKVEIYSCNSVDDYSGLGDHELLLIRECPYFAELLTEYRNEQKHKELFSTIHHLFWCPTGDYSVEAQQIW
jgi:hypothetical protein